MKLKFGEYSMLIFKMTFILFLFNFAFVLASDNTQSVVAAKTIVAIIDDIPDSKFHISSYSMIC